jgi:hypothetical protein|tara:strand:+ start:166 stop:438 length:273 start_codon:yes stop_codon:yes gene_type:complete
MGGLLKSMGMLAEAIPLFSEELESLVVLRGMEYQETRDSANHLVQLLRNAGQHDEATALAAKHDVCNNSDDDSDDDGSDDDGSACACTCC